MALSESERKERHREANHRYYLKNKERIIERTSKKQADNPERYRGYQKAWRDRNQEKERLRARRKNWKKLPKPTRPEPAVCECCNKPDPRKALSLDHCHITGVFRGWLCSKCNLAIGKLGDTLECVEKVVEYLRRSIP